MTCYRIIDISAAGLKGAKPLTSRRMLVSRQNGSLTLEERMALKAKVDGCSLEVHFGLEGLISVIGLTRAIAIL